MAQSLVSTVSIVGSVTGSTALTALDAAFDLKTSLNLLAITPSASCVFADTRALAAGAADVLDLSGPMVDLYGRPAVYGAVNVILLIADLANAGDLTLGGDAGAPFDGPLSAGGRLKVAPGGVTLLSTPDPALWSAAQPLLRIVNPTGFPAAYQLVLVGAPATDADGELDFSDPGNPLLAVI